MRVIALHAENKPKPGACELYRINQPLYHLGKVAGWQVGWDTMHTVFGEWYIKAQAGDRGVSVYKFLESIDVLVLPRMRIMDEAVTLMLEDLVELSKQFDVKLIYEVDDDFTNEHRSVIAGKMEEVASRCDAITVTTPFLAETMARVTGKPTYVLPNMLDPAIWRNGDIRRNLSEDNVLIWLSGSKTHINDWKVLEEVFTPLLYKHPHARLVICGYHPDYLSNIEGAVYLDGVDYGTYAQMVRQSDIVLAPVDPTDGFNMGKSPIKAVEGMGAVRKVQNQFCGAAVIATNNPVYRLAVRDGLDGMLVEHEPQAWFDGMDKLLSDAPLRRRLQQNAYNTVWKKGHWDITRKWSLWADAYRKIASQSKQKVKFAPVGEGVV